MPKESAAAKGRHTRLGGPWRRAISQTPFISSRFKVSSLFALSDSTVRCDMIKSHKMGHQLLALSSATSLVA